MTRESEPVFFYSLPQNVHLAVASKRPVPAGESYPPEFYDRIASSVHRLDACVGSFVDELKRRQLYDDSILILTSDHGDSLGEEGRWGHAYYMYPEVMRVPLIVHLPSWLKNDVRADTKAVAFTADITPSLYALLGYHPADLGPLFGRPLFTARDADPAPRRDANFLLASSYGAVYGILRHDGRDLYVVDAVDGEDYAFDLSGPPRRIDPSPAMTSENRKLIAGELAALAATYGVTSAR
ncbi:MAG TPA: sulfatase-like hydrolase/transferase, partial [Rhodanobacteraceae bacterium]